MYCFTTDILYSGLKDFYKWEHNPCFIFFITLLSNLSLCIYIKSSIIVSCRLTDNHQCTQTKTSFSLLVIKQSLRDAWERGGQAGPTQDRKFSLRWGLQGRVGDGLNGIGFGSFSQHSRLVERTQEGVLKERFEESQGLTR